MYGYGLNRFLCSVLEDMRSLVKVSKDREAHKQMMMSLIEEAQVMGNRMEAGLEDRKDYKEIHKQIKEARKELAELQDKVSAIKSDD